MKYFFQLLIIFCSLNTFAISKSNFIQNSTNQNKEDRAFTKSISIALILAHHFTTKEAEMLGWQSSLFNPGIEGLINFDYKRFITFSSGLQFQHCKIGYEQSFYGERVTYSELSVPLLFSKSFIKTKMNKIGFNTGIYFGCYLDPKMETKGNKLKPNNNWDIFPKEHIENYSNDNFLADLHLGFHYHDNLEKQNYFRFNLYTKYKLKNHWINNDVSRFVVGVKLIYLFNI